MAKNTMLWIGIGVVAVVLLASSGIIDFGTILGGAPPTTPTITPGIQTEQCPYQPTATYAAKNKYSTTMLTGTSYYKEDGKPATTTAMTNFNKGEDYTYWIDNSSYYTKPVTLVAGCGTNTFVADSYANTTSNPSFTSYDLVNRQTTTDGASNATLAASGTTSQEFTYMGLSKYSAFPFGGVMVVEYNSSIASVTCTGEDITPSTDFHVTYTVRDTSFAYKVYGLKPSIDDGTGSVRTIDCQFKNGATALASKNYVKLISANYYVGNDGNFYLDVEKTMNDDTTRTGHATRTVMFATASS